MVHPDGITVLPKRPLPVGTTGPVTGVVTSSPTGDLNRMDVNMERLVG